MAFGHCVTLWISAGSLLLGRKKPSLPFRLDDCRNETWDSVNRTAALIRQNETTILPPDL